MANGSARRKADAEWGLVTSASRRRRKRWAAVGLGLLVAALAGLVALGFLGGIG